jgi:hypothetical protein
MPQPRWPCGGIPHGDGGWGAVDGGWLGNAVGWYGAGEGKGYVMALIGALILIVLYLLVAVRRA